LSELAEWLQTLFVAGCLVELARRKHFGINYTPLTMQESKPSILITGATGNIGKELIKELAARKVAFRAMVRSAKAEIASIERAEVMIGDFCTRLRACIFLVRISLAAKELRKRGQAQL
jgi:FlaA1/EpsC-like NDP-sugar epimerase